MGAATFITIDHGDGEVLTLRKIGKAILAGLGLYGNDIVSDTTLYSNGTWWIFHALTDCVFDTVTFKAGTSSGSLSGKTLAKGDRLYGPIISLQLTSGTGILYRITT